MIISRLISIVFRVAQLVFAAIVLGLTAFFLDERSRRASDDFLARIIFAIIWSALSIIAAIIWVIPTKWAMTGYISDFIFTAGWAAVFAIFVVDWSNGDRCGSEWAWRSISFKGDDDGCGQWRAVQAFSFLSMIVWFATFLLGIVTYLRLRRRPTRGPSNV